LDEPSFSLSVVIPVYNSQAILAPLLERLEPALRALTPNFEVILVDDNSPDGSWKKVLELGAEHAYLRGIHLMRNFGQHNALLCGIRAAKSDYIVTMDDDLQHPPEEIQRLLKKLQEGHDVVYGSPEAEQHGLLRDAASLITKFALQKAMGSDTARKSSAFRIFRRELRDSFATFKSQFVSIDVLLTWGSTKFTSIDVKHDARAEGVSNYTFKKLLTHALNMLTGFSVFPLQIASLIGFAATFFGVCILAYVLFTALTRDGGVPGFPFLASIIAIFSGAQLFALGIIGEYLARMHFRMMERPTYCVGETTDAA